MFLMLGAAISVLFLLVAAQPNSEAGAVNTLTSGDDPILESAALDGQNVVTDGGPDGAISPTANLGSISPVFTDEVRYWEQDILGWAKEYALDPNLVAIIMQVESCGDPQAISIAGAQGLFQVMPFHFIDGEDSLDPNTNARRGINYFVDRLAQTGGDIGRSYAGYNGGHVAAGSSWDNWAYETQRYYIWTTGLYGDIQSGLAVSPTLERWLQAGGASLCRQAASRLGIGDQGLGIGAQ
jgi:soluble lytic murein transglycosylase-like protein